MALERSGVIGAGKPQNSFEVGFGALLSGLVKGRTSHG
jgi:hypothetical protein